MTVKAESWLPNNIYINLNLISPNCASHTVRFSILKTETRLKISQIILIVKYDATGILKIVKNFITRNIISVNFNLKLLCFFETGVFSNNK